MSTARSQALQVHSPFDGSLVGEVAYTPADVMAKAMDTAWALYRNRAGWIPADERAAILRRAAALLESRRDSVIDTSVREGGKPLRDTIVEFDRAIDGLMNCSELIRSEGGHVVPMGATPASRGRMAFTQREPIGPVLALSAFNHPINLIVHQIGPAIAGGCPVLVKAARNTPLSCLNVVQALWDAGLPKEWCQVLVPASHDELDALVSDSRVRFLSFIGSAEVGWGLRARIAPGTRCALEHGGIAPVIVAECADLDLAAQSVAKGGFYHAGQVCVSVQRVYVHETVAEAFIERLADEARAMTTGDPLSDRTDVGPLIKASEADRVASWIDEAVNSGARDVVAGERLGPTLLTPTVLVDAPKGSNVLTREIFGPVVCVQTYGDLSAACADANATPFAFQAAVFAKSLDTVTRVYNEIEASAVMVNDHSAFRVDWMPFAGLNQSGLGVGGIPATYHEMTIEKMLVLRK